MKLGYSNYAMQMVDVFEALPRLKSIGYEAMEICVRDGWQTEAAAFDGPSRQRLVSLIRELGFPPPPLMDSMEVCIQGVERKAMLARAAGTFSMARDVNFGDGPLPVTTTLGSPPPEWESGRGLIRDSLVELADLAAEYGSIVAIEPHAGSLFDTPEKAVWLMEQTDHEHLKLNFDISHFVAQGIDVRHSVELCVPYAVHTHVKDGYTEDGSVRYQMAGEGDLDWTEYMVAVQEADLKPPVYVEVSRQQSELAGYDPWQAAEFCYATLDRARREAAARVSG
jgi:sugar phosphate isomerase/epimerase